ncbi:hypothetical protein D3C85_1694590 [compost metagenome]
MSKSSITAITVSGAEVVAVGLDGLMVRSLDGGRVFQEQKSADGVSLTAALFTGQDEPVLFSRRGVVPVQAR